MVYHAVVIIPEVDCWLWHWFQILLQGRDYDRVLEKFIYHSSSILVPVDGVILLLLDPLFFLFSLAAVEAGKAVLSNMRKLKKEKGCLKKEG